MKGRSTWWKPMPGSPPRAKAYKQDQHQGGSLALPPFFLAHSLSFLMTTARVRQGTPCQGVLLQILQSISNKERLLPAHAQRRMLAACSRAHLKKRAGESMGAYGEREKDSPRAAIQRAARRAVPVATKEATGSDSRDGGFPSPQQAADSGYTVQGPLSPVPDGQSWPAGAGLDHGPALLHTADTTSRPAAALASRTFPGYHKKMRSPLPIPSRLFFAVMAERHWRSHL